MNEEVLIELVKGYEFLYQMNTKEYRDQKLRKEAWEAIGEKLGFSGNACKDQWTKLRNAYTNALKRRKSKPNEFGKRYIKWKFEDEMSFLAPSLLSQSFGNNFNEWEEEEGREGGFETDETFNDSCYEQDSQVYVKSEPLYSPSSCDYSFPHPSSLSSNPASHEPSKTVSAPTFFFTSSTPNSNQGPKPVVKMKKKQGNPALNEVVKLMRENNRMRSDHMSASMMPNYANDETEMFFLSLARNVKKLSREEQVKVKMEISNAVFQAELRDINHAPTTSPATSSAQSTSFSNVSSPPMVSSPVTISNDAALEELMS